MAVNLDKEIFNVIITIMKIKKVMLFCYDFPHKKTQDFLIRLLIEGYKVEYVIAAPLKKLDIQEPSVHIAPHHIGLIHPKVLCNMLGVTYNTYDHNSQESINYVIRHSVDLYIISGARILSSALINASHQRILNIHPGLLPEMRGLDTLPWSIYENIPIGISGHLISQKIDGGFLIYKENLSLYYDDTIIDVSLRLLEKQSDILIKSIKQLETIKTPVRNLDSKKICIILK